MNKETKILIRSKCGHDVEFEVAGFISLSFSPQQAKDLAASLLTAHCNARGVAIEAALSCPIFMTSLLTHGHTIQ